MYLHIQIDQFIYLYRRRGGEGALATPDAGKSCFVFVFAFALRCVAMRCDACVRASGGGGARLGRDFKVIIHGAGWKSQVANTISLPTPGPETGDPGIAQGDPGIAQGLLKWPLWLGWAGPAGWAGRAGWVVCSVPALWVLPLFP